MPPLAEREARHRQGRQPRTLHGHDCFVLCQHQLALKQTKPPACNTPRSTPTRPFRDAMPRLAKHREGFLTKATKRFDRERPNCRQPLVGHCRVADSFVALRLPGCGAISTRGRLLYLTARG